MSETFNIITMDQETLKAVNWELQIRIISSLFESIDRNWKIVFYFYITYYFHRLKKELKKFLNPAFYNFIIENLLKILKEMCNFLFVLKVIEKNSQQKPSLVSEIKQPSSSLPILTVVRTSLDPFSEFQCEINQTVLFCSCLYSVFFDLQEAFLEEWTNFIFKNFTQWDFQVTSWPFYKTFYARVMFHVSEERRAQNISKSA